jgi:paired amphipathic helix protein Sin3a
MKRVSILFYGYPELIQGFNTFLPVGWHIDAQSEDITVITPTETMGLNKKSGAGADGQEVFSWNRAGITSAGDTGVLA